MKSTKLFCHLLKVLLTSVVFISCHRDGAGVIDPVQDPGNSTFLVINEGSYGRSPASINHYCDGEWKLRLFKGANAGKTLGKTGVNAVMHNTDMYIVSKEGCFLSQVNRADLREKACIEMSETGNNPLGDAVQARNFCVLDEKRGVLTTSGGAFAVSLSPLKLGKMLTDTEDNEYAFGDICCVGRYVFLINNSKIKVFRTTDLEFVKELGSASAGFVQTSSGILWASNDTEFVKINSEDLTVERFQLGRDHHVYYSAGAYRPASLCASEAGDAIYYVKKTGDGWNVTAKEIWRFDPVTRKSQLFFKPSVDNISVYGAALALNPATGDLHVTYTENGNYLNTSFYVIDGKTGTQKKIIPYTKPNETEYWFPSVVLFVEKNDF